MVRADSEDLRDWADRADRGWPSHSFLAATPDPVLRDLLEAARPVTFAPGKTLMNEGDKAEEVFFLLSSCVKVTAALANGGRALLAIRVGGDVVGEIAATDGGPRLATVRVCGREPVQAAAVDLDSFTQLTSQHPQLLLQLAQTLGRRLRTATQRHIDFSGCKAVVCLARILVELADDYGQPLPNKGVIIGIDLTRIELGTMVGYTETTAQRALRQLRDKGIIDTRSRRPLVRDMRALRQLAYPGGVPRQRSGED